MAELKKNLNNIFLMSLETPESDGKRVGIIGIEALTYDSADIENSGDRNQLAIVDLRTDVVTNQELLAHISNTTELTSIEGMPVTAWNSYSSKEYGFFSNVNPEVPHPRWSQAEERVLGRIRSTARRKTEKFNGYGEQVAALYRGMDLSKDF